MLMTNQVQNPTLESLDEQKLNRLHWRMVITAGTGFLRMLMIYSLSALSRHY